MAMTKKDYEVIAKVFKKRTEEMRQFEPHTSYYIGSMTSMRMLAQGLSSSFAAANPRFNRHRFLIACGVV